MFQFSFDFRTFNRKLFRFYFMYWMDYAEPSFDISNKTNFNNYLLFLSLVSMISFYFCVYITSYCF